MVKLRRPRSSARISSRAWFRGVLVAAFWLSAAFTRPAVAESAEPPATGVQSGVHGSIAVDTAWEGRFVVDGMVTVEPGASLTIRPGTEVRFAAGGGLTVKGVLRAEGTADGPILFLPASEGQEPWAGITLNAASPASALRSCRIARAAAMSIGAGEHRVEGCDISGGPVGIAVTGAGTNPVITGNRISDVTEAGVTCTNKAAPTIADNVLERCGKVGIDAQANTAPRIRGNRVSGCEGGIQVVRAPALVSGNTVTGCSRGIALSSISGGEPLRGNRVEGNEVGILCQLFSSPEISGNVVVKNVDGIVCFRMSSANIHHNDVLDNETGITCSQFSDATISANTIARNGRGIFLLMSSFAAVHGNNLEDNKMQIESAHLSLAYEKSAPDKPFRGRLQQNANQVGRGMATPLATKDDGFNPAGRTLDLSGNWWGEATTREMEEKGPDANISTLNDGYDVPLMNGYPQEKIVYAPWAKQRIAATGVPAP